MAIYHHRHMGKAAEHLFVSQPAVSQSLQKLRHHFDDGLFVKTPQGMMPTPFSEQLADRLIPVMGDLHKAVNQSVRFDPMTCRRHLQVVLNSQLATSMIGKLMEELNEKAPYVNIEVLSWNDNTLNRLNQGEELLVFHYDGVKTPSSVSKQVISELLSSLYVRQGHPLGESITSIKQLRGFDIASVIIPGYNADKAHIVQYLEAQGEVANVGFRSEYPLAIVDALAHSDMYLPGLSIFPLHHFPGVRRVAIDIEGSRYAVNVCAYRHQRFDDDPLFQWLTETVRRILINLSSVKN